MKYLKKISFNAPVTLSFTIICLIVVILGALTHNATTYSLFTIYRTSFLDPLLYVRLFTHVLGHIDFSHFANNMTLFLLTAPLLEEKYGSKRLLFIILFVAFITGLINIIFTNNSLLGASGVVFAFIILSSITGNDSGIPLTLIIVATIYLSNEIYAAITVSDTISQLTHIIGGICGAFVGFYFKKC